MQTAGKTLPGAEGVTARRRRSQRGSALLVVLVFAAIIAIMLYRELPIAAFEAQRQKEELLVSRGNEYKRGVKLFVRKVGRFPNSIDELENTNRMRFLRHRYIDPFTGKDNWRLIHAGPGGTIVDSKVKSTTTGTKASNALGQGAVFAGFNNTFTGDATATGENTPPSAGMRQRPAATKNASGPANDPLAVAAAGGDPTDTAANGNNVSAGQNSSAIGNPQVSLNPATGVDLATGKAFPDGKQPPNGDPAALAGNGISTTAQQLNNVNPRTPEQANTSAFSNTPSIGNTSTFGNTSNSLTGNGGNGQIGAAGGIAGVASAAEGKSIKTVNDQTKYKLWEFYYDLQKDQAANLAAASKGLPGQTNTNSNNNGNNSAFGNNNSAFGNNNNSGSAFGQTQQQSSFGQASPTPQPTTQPTQQLQQQQ